MLEGLTLFSLNALEGSSGNPSSPTARPGGNDTMSTSPRLDDIGELAAN